MKIVKETAETTYFKRNFIPFWAIPPSKKQNEKRYGIVALLAFLAQSYPFILAYSYPKPLRYRLLSAQNARLTHRLRLCDHKNEKGTFCV